MEEKLKIYRFLGAEKFQKFVFFIEKMKYSVINKFFPNIEDWYDKRVDKSYVNKLKILEKDKRNHYLFKKYKIDKYLPFLVTFYDKITNKCYGDLKKQTEIDDITGKNRLLLQHKLEKYYFKKELVYRKNRNYHYDKNFPTRIINYLKINKKIHKRSLAINFTFLTLLGIYALSPLPKISLLMWIFGIYQLVSAFKNFQCINLQNYNLCRFEEKETLEKLTELDIKTKKRNIEKMKNCIEPVYNVVMENINNPTIDEVVDNITSKEEALELLKYAKSQLNYLEKQKDTNFKQKKIGGR